MTPLQSWMMLLLAGIIAYLIAYIFNYFSRTKTERELKKYFKSDLDKYKAVKIVETAQKIALDSGYDEETAFKKSCFFLNDVVRNGLLNEKYEMLRGA